MAGPSREVVISYGSFDSNDTFWHLHGAHTIDLDERTFRCVYTVVCVGGSAALVDSAIATAEQQLNVRHRDFKIVIDGETLFHFGDGADGVGSTVEAAEFIQATWEHLGTHRSKKSRAIRITVEVTRAANQPNKLGVLDQAIRVTTNREGIRRMSFRAQFTPGPNGTGDGGDAEDRFEDGTYGFDALVSAIQTVLTGEWERTGNLSTAYDEDKRTLTASASYTELIYAQSAAATNDPDLVGATYDYRLERKAAFTIPGRLSVAPFTAVTILFSSGVLKDQTQDLSNVIDTKIIPYVRNTVISTLRLPTAGQVYYLGHGLRADPVSNRIAGNVFFLVQESPVLEISKRIADVGRTGDNLVAVYDGSRWKRDVHTGPGKWIRRVVISARVVGLDASGTLDSIEQAEGAAHTAAGFYFTGWAVNSSPSVEIFRDPGGSSVTTTVQTRVLEFERADVRSAAQPGGGGGLVSLVNRENVGASGEELSGFRERG